MHRFLRLALLAASLLLRSKVAAWEDDFPPPVIFEPRGAPDSSAILLHGFNETAELWVDVVPYLSAGLPNTTFILPTARELPLGNGSFATAWYASPTPEKDDVANLNISSMYLESLVLAEVESGIDSRRVAVIGFSQGASMALLSLRVQLPLAGVASLSGRLIPLNGPPVSEENEATPVLLLYGDADPIVPVRYGAEAFEGLAAAGLNTTLVGHPESKHEVARPELEDLKHFLEQQLASTD